MDTITSKKLGELILSIPNGNSKAIEEIYAILGKIMHSVAFIYVKNKEDVEEVIQDSMFKIVQFAATFRENKNAYAWINTIVKNTAMDHWRVNKRRESIVVEKEVSYDFNELDIIMRDAMSVLTDKERDVVIYYYWYRMTFTEMSKVLHVPRSTLKYRLDKALENMKKYLEK